MTAPVSGRYTAMSRCHEKIKCKRSCITTEYGFYQPILDNRKGFVRTLATDIKGLNDVGFGVSIDDFGTGYSSLSYLKRFKAYKLKIDQSFIRDITTNAEDRAIVTAIISMAKSLGLRTIAEGVETAEQLVYLREQGCDEVQGYYFSKPLTAVQFKKFMLNSCEVPVPEGRPRRRIGMSIN